MQHKIKKNIASFVLTACILMFPFFVFAADWGVGYDTSTGGLSIGVGSNGSGAGNIWGGGGAYGGGWNLTNPYGLPSGSILGIVSNLLFWLLSLFAILGVIGFIISIFMKLFF